VSFALVTESVEVCDEGLTNGGVFAVLTLRLGSGGEPAVYGEWLDGGIVNVSSVPDGIDNFTLDFDWDLEPEAKWVQFRLVQWEHGGGYCNCWGVVPGSWSVASKSQ